MSKIKIGEREFATRRPKDLDEQLVKSTGCNAAELAGILQSTPDLAARALVPFLHDDQVSSAELANLIAADPVSIDVIGALYSSEEPHIPEASTSGDPVVSPPARKRAENEPPAS